ncbi:Rieske (2Fe-2S) protein [Halovulum sp. GXIMD14794]
MKDWRGLPRAPQPGTLICAEDALPASGTLGVELDGFPLLLVRGATGLVAFFNACPHQYLPLDWRKSDVLSADGLTLLCSNHDAGFDAATGQGIDGHGEGCALVPVPVTLSGGEVRIAG